MSAPLPAPTALQTTAQHFLGRFEGLRQRMHGDLAARDLAAAAWRAHGLPGPREEAWRYTQLRPLADIEFAEPVMPLSDHAALLARLPEIEGPRLVFIDGRFRRELSDLPVGITVRTGTPRFGPRPSGSPEKLVALNTMLAQDGVAIDVAAGVDGGTVILASLGSDAHGRPVSFHPRHSVRLDAAARFTLIELSAGEGTYLHSPVFDFEIGEDATLTHLRLQDEALEAFHLSTLYADIAARGTYDSFALTLGARLARMEVHARLSGAGGAVHLNAAQLLDGSQHADFTTVVSHDAPSCASRQTVKNVLAGRSRGVFQGKIEVARVAQKTDGYQMNQALLLSPDAEIDSKPQLEIYADDVKCSHGATVGELDAEQLFYLRSRGVPAEDARSLLIRAFLTEALDPIAHVAGRAMLEAAVDRRWTRRLP